MVPIITVIIRMTGLLLLVPDSVATGTHSGRFPLHVLMPIEGDSVPPHVAQLGWHSARKADCKYTFDHNVCWVNLENWSVEMAAGGSPSTGVVLPPLALMLSDASHRVDRELFTGTPGRRLRSRVTLHSGRVEHECPIARWRHDGQDSLLLTNVVTWVTTIDSASMATLTRSELDPVGPSPATRQIVLPGATHDTLELFIRHIPAHEVHGKPEPATANVTRGTHLHSFYDLLRFPDADPGRKIPLFQRGSGHACKFTKSPGAPTCLVGTALPPG